MSRTNLKTLFVLSFGSVAIACSAGEWHHDDDVDDDTQDTFGASELGEVKTSSQALRRWRLRRRDAGAGTTDAGSPAADAATRDAATSDASARDASAPESSAPDTSTPPPPPPPPSPSSGSPRLGGCDLYPADNPWNRDVSNDPVHAKSATYIANMAPSSTMHADWGTTAEQYGIPINIGSGAAPLPVTWTTSWGPRESDKLACPSGGGNFCYPLPTNAKIEGGPSAASSADRHLLYLDTSGAPSSCTLYELYMTQNFSGSGWRAGNGAIFHLGSNALRPDGWTSGDAAGLPILPGLVRYDEIVAGEIKHAVRFTLSATQQAYIHPATHAAGSSSSSLPPMGLRVRLKANVNPTGATAAAKVLIDAMKKYGLILADNGSNWYVTGDTNDGWSSVQGGIQSALRQIHGSDFEVVESGPVSTNGL